MIEFHGDLAKMRRSRLFRNNLIIIFPPFETAEKILLAIIEWSNSRGVAPSWG